MKNIIATRSAPAAIGPYSQAVKAGSLLFTAGQIGLVPETGQMVEGGVVQQAEQVLKNLQVVAEAAGCSLASVVKTTIYLVNAADFAAVNDVYAKFFDSEPPARSTVFVNALPKGALVEIDAVAEL
jgi:2-iminobutanoate/2-iminopropanoate deaminase